MSSPQGGVCKRSFDQAFPPSTKWRFPAGGGGGGAQQPPDTAWTDLSGKVQLQEYTSCIGGEKDQLVEIRSSEDPDSQEPVATVSRAVLCSRSNVMQTMLSVSMKESSSCRIELNASKAGILCFMSFLYTGKPPPSCSADAVEVWMLAHMYDVDGVKQWITAHCLNVQTVAAAIHFACGVPSPWDVCPALKEACRLFIRDNVTDLEPLTSAMLADISKEAMRFMMDSIHYAQNVPGNAWEFFMRWYECNGGGTDLLEGSGVARILLPALPNEVVLGGVRNSGLFPENIHVYYNGVDGTTKMLTGVNLFTDTHTSLMQKIERIEGAKPTSYWRRPCPNWKDEPLIKIVGTADGFNFTVFW